VVAFSVPSVGLPERHIRKDIKETYRHMQQFDGVWVYEQVYLQKADPE